MTTAYATNLQVKQRLGGDTPSFSDAWDSVITDIISQVQAELDREVAKARGCGLPWSFIADSAASVRYYNTPAGGIRYLPIDDCVSIEAVYTYSSPGGTATTLTHGSQWYEKQGDSPIVGIYRTDGVWTSNQIAGVGVKAKWGYATSCPLDVTGSTIQETIREYLAARAGDDDRVGSHVFGTVVISKAFTQKTIQMINTYGYGGAQFRG